MAETDKPAHLFLVVDVHTRHIEGKADSSKTLLFLSLIEAKSISDVVKKLEPYTGSDSYWEDEGKLIWTDHGEHSVHCLPYSWEDLRRLSDTTGCVLTKFPITGDPKSYIKKPADYVFSSFYDDDPTWTTYIVSFVLITPEGDAFYQVEMITAIDSKDIIKKTEDRVSEGFKTYQDMDGKTIKAKALGIHDIDLMQTDWLGFAGRVSTWVAGATLASLDMPDSPEEYVNFV